MIYKTIYNFNFLPYREENKKHKTLEFYKTMFIFASLGTLLMILWWVTMEQKAETQNQRNQYLEQEIKKLDIQMEKVNRIQKEIDDLTQREKLIDSLQDNRIAFIQLINDLESIMPNGLKINSILQNNEDDTIVTIIGETTSNLKISELLTNLQNNSNYSKAQLEEIKGLVQKDGRTNSEFTIHFTAIK